MGKLINGKWVVNPCLETDDKTGEFKRSVRTFRDTISNDHKIYTPDSNRYHLYISYACPWAHRTMIFKELKGLSKHISVSVVHPDMLENGWSFAQDFPNATGDDLYNLDYLYEIYQKADNTISTNVTVPVLWDKHTKTIVNNESSEIIRIFNSSFNELTKNENDYYPSQMQEDINALNSKIYDAINNGVYRCGFATNQKAYDRAINSLFNLLDELDVLLENNKYLLGDKLTEVDLRLIPTLLRFDIVYATHFKCNIKTILDYKNLSRYRNDLYQLDAIKNTTDFDHIKRHYYFSHENINPYRIIPKGPIKFL